MSFIVSYLKILGLMDGGLNYREVDVLGKQKYFLKTKIYSLANQRNSSLR